MVNTSVISGVYVDIENINEEVFIPNKYSLFSLKNDIVEVLIYPKKGGKMWGGVKSNRKKKRYLCWIIREVSKGFGFVIPDTSISFDIFIPKTQINPLVIGKKVLVKVINWD